MEQAAAEWPLQCQIETDSLKTWSETAFFGINSYRTQGPHMICCGEGVVRIGIGNGPLVAVQTLVVDRELLGYELLLGLNAITQLGGIAMSGTSKVRFPQHGTLICAAITIDGPNFHAEYDKGKRIWTASWKWSGNQPPVSLKNRLSEYPTPKRCQGEYERELQAQIQNGWLIPYLLGKDIKHERQQ